jgi:hypothetical protein
MSHRYILSGIPYLKQSGRPIYKVPTRGNRSNPNNYKNGMVSVVSTWPFGNTTLEDTISTPTPGTEERSIVVGTVVKDTGAALASFIDWYDNR